MNSSIGDNVRIRTTKETEDAGVAGLEGQVYGETTPSITGVEVIGSPSTDHAINVHLESCDEAYWFASELVEFLDHASGTEIRLEGVDKQWTRMENGGWHEKSLAEEKRPWWKFWYPVVPIQTVDKDIREMKSLWKALFPLIVLATVAFAAFEGYQLWGVLGAAGGAVFGLLAGYAGWKTFDVRG